MTMVWQIMQIRKLWNYHAGLAREASNIPIKIRVFNWVLIWILHYSSDKQIIQMVTDIKFAIINLSIGSSEERLSCFDCNVIEYRYIFKYPNWKFDQH